uniref:PGG domain-containing protein n=1 Tax=Fagus sylvatica TaxID=28930 RepID=A0A2N9IF83_FAGSY
MSNLQHEKSLRSEIERYQYKPGEDSATSDIRNALLVVATLIVAVTFQAGVNPPGGVWQEDAPPPSSYDAGKAILGYKGVSFAFFLLSNTAAFSTSATIIGILVRGFPFYYLVRLALLLMVCTYVASISAVLPPDGVVSPINLCIALLLPFILLIVRHLWRRINELCALCWSCICCCCNKK